MSLAGAHSTTRVFGREVFARRALPLLLAQERHPRRGPALDELVFAALQGVAGGVGAEAAGVLGVEDVVDALVARPKRHDVEAVGDVRVLGFADGDAGLG